MSVFDDNITSKTEIEEFYDDLRSWIIKCFDNYYDLRGGDLKRLCSEYNYTISQHIGKFHKFNIYHPWIHAIRVADLTSPYPVIVLSLFYSEDPVCYVHEERKTLISVKFRISTPISVIL